MSSVFGTGRVAYPGLRAFGREEFDLFFGRESCVDEMVDTLGRTCFLAVLGTSGSGKSSLVRTGLLNALELGFLASAGSTWRIAELRPRGQPIRSLADRAPRPPGQREAGRGGDRDPLRLPPPRTALADRMGECGTSAAARQPDGAGRPVRGAFPLRGLLRPRGGGGLRRAPGRRRPRERADLRRDHHALGVSRRLHADRRPARGHQPRPLPHPAHEPRPVPPGDRRAGRGLRLPDRGRPRQQAPQRPHRLRAVGVRRRPRPAAPPRTPRRPAAADAARAQPPVAAGAGAERDRHRPHPCRLRGGGRARRRARPPCRRGRRHRAAGACRRHRHGVPRAGDGQDRRRRGAAADPLRRTGGTRRRPPRFGRRRGRRLPRAGRQLLHPRPAGRRSTTTPSSTSRTRA